YITANNTVFEFPMGAGPWGPAAQVSLNTPPGATIFSSAMLDWQNGDLYVASYNVLYRLPYPIAASDFAMGAQLYGIAPGLNDAPRSSPLIWNSSVYIGDAAGYAEKYDCLQRGSAPQFAAVTQKYGSTVDTTPVID